MSRANNETNDPRVRLQIARPRVSDDPPTAPPTLPVSVFPYRRRDSHSVLRVLSAGRRRRGGMRAPRQRRQQHGELVQVVESAQPEAKQTRRRRVGRGYGERGGDRRRHTL